MTLTPGMLRALKLLLEQSDDDGQEIVCDGLSCMIGLNHVAARTVRGLLMHMAIKDAGYAGVGCRIYCPTPNSAAILARPALADEMVARVVSNRPFFVDEHGQCQDVGRPEAGNALGHRLRQRAAPSRKA